MINDYLSLKFFLWVHFFLFAVMLRLCFSSPTIDEAAIARINAYRNSTGTGTGFLISTGDIVTAYHNIHGARRIDVYVDKIRYQDVEVVAVRPETDMALLRVPIRVGFKYYQTTSSSPNIVAGAKAYIHGLPLGFDNQLIVARLTQSGYLLSQNWTNPSGQKIFYVDNLSLVPLDVTSEPGMSGSPVLDESGFVIGVFSGSIREGGRGYAWTIPIQYADPQQMKNIRKPASQIKEWPDFIFLKPGLVTLQSLNPNSQAARLANQCRDQIEAYDQSWKSQLNTANRAYMKFMMAKPAFEEILTGTTKSNSDSQLSKLTFHYEILEPVMDEFVNAQSNFEKETAELLTTCYSYTTFNSLHLEDLPATRNNIITIKKFNDRMKALSASQEKIDAAGDRIKRNYLSMISNVTNLAGTDSSSSYNTIQNISKALQLSEQGLKMVLSQEQADYISHYIQDANAWAEIVEAFELQDWDRQLQSYNHEEPSGLTLKLSNGWIRFDSAIRNAILAPGKHFSNDIKFIKLGSVASPTPPKAMAEVYWRPSRVPLQPNNQSQIDNFWRTANAEWQSLQHREGGNFSNTKRYANYVGSDLLLEITADMKFPDRTATYHAYQSSRINGNGTASLTCLLLSDDVNYQDCMTLVNTMNLPD